MIFLPNSASYPVVDKRSPHDLHLTSFYFTIQKDMGRMGGKANALAVKQLDGGVRTKPELVASAVWKLVNEEETLQNSYMIVDNHTIRTTRF